MQLSPEILKFPKELGNILFELMTGATFSEHAIHEDSLPLLLVRRSHTVVAFGVGEMSDYSSLYEAFKKLYLLNASEWSSKDISFVFCIPEESKADESFRSEVEVNVYFCRKYVIHLKGNLAECLLRLPFIPLSPVSPGQQTRPPSAQTLLQHNKIRADFAKALIVPSTSSASRILDDCIDGRYGDTHKLTQPQNITHFDSQIEDRVQTTLKSISIENFRAYRKKKEFALGSAITILYGPNGFGKTSFFDAIDFAVTGGVGRLSKANGGLSKAAKHLDSGDESTKVTLTFERNGLQHEITRDLADQNNPLVDGKVTSRKEVLSLLTGGVAEGMDRVENMVALFRATHLFSQDSQELTRYVAEKCELPADIVSRMLAFEDYVNGLKKAEEVLKYARGLYKKDQELSGEISKTISIDREELSRLEGLVAENTQPRAIEERFAELKSEISIAGFSIEGIQLSDTRSLRAILESFAVEAADARKTVSKFLESRRNLNSLLEELEPLTSKLEEYKSYLESARLEVDRAANMLSTLTHAELEAKAQETKSKNQCDWLVWAESANSEHTQLGIKVQTIHQQLPVSKKLLDDQKELYAKAVELQLNEKAKLQRCDFVLSSIKHLRNELQKVNALAVLWKGVNPKLNNAQDNENKLQQSIQKLKHTLDEAHKLEHALEVNVSKLERELDAAINNDSSLKILIAELRAHIDGANCLLCGHDHGTQNELLAAIDKRMQQGDQVNQLSEMLAVERSKLHLQIVLRHNLADELNHETRSLENTKRDVEQIELQRLTYESALNSVGLSLSDNSELQLEQLIVQTNESELSALNALNEAKELQVKADNELTSASDSLKRFEREHDVIVKSFEEATSRMSVIESDAKRGSIDLTVGTAALLKAKHHAEWELAQASASFLTCSNELKTHKANYEKAKSTLDTTRAYYQELSQAWNSYHVKIQSLEAELAAAGFGGNVSEEYLRNQIISTTDREVSALRLRDLVAKLELALDTAATSAAFQNLRQRIEDNKTLVQLAESRVLKIKPWIDFFEEITKLLGKQQATATEKFINEYGARTAMIQQRLRPVYGFGEIEVSTKDSAISIRVQRKGEKLKPTDYFSQSQVQTLVLGLFLTACSSQTWSGFSSIMLDDPVTHFDDLNTYALLDLILGLQSTPEGAQQFVISTCDEKLLQLARQKFKHLGSAAKFYRFTAVGASGPMVDEIPM